MIQLNRSMMERYEITDHRPQKVRAVLMGANRLMLGAAARLLDRAGLGALCVTPAASALRAQDGMFTLLVRGEENGMDVCREEVVQSILQALDPEEEFSALLEAAANPELEFIFLSLNSEALEIALTARFLYARRQAGMEMPLVILAGEHPAQDRCEQMRDNMLRLSCGWSDVQAFAAWLRPENFRALLADGFSGRLNEGETAKARHDMNYSDDFIAWAEPTLNCTLQGEIPESLRPALQDGDFEAACLKKARVMDALVFLCAVSGFLSGKDSFADTLKDEKLRDWIGHAFFDEVMPALPYAREEIAAEVIAAFTRLENSMNDMPLLEIGRGLIGNLPRTLLPAIRSWAEKEFEAPERLSLALCAAIMIYAGARINDRGEYEVLRGNESCILRDDPEILAAFSCLSHDMPAESLAYAALADRAIWGEDLREIDGLEMRIAFGLSSIQRVGWKETMKTQLQ